MGLIKIKLPRYFIILLIEGATGNQNFNCHTAKMGNTLRLAKFAGFIKMPSKSKTLLIIITNIIIYNENFPQLFFLLPSDYP